MSNDKTLIMMTKRNFVTGCLLVLGVAVVTIPDVLFGSLFELLHFLFELLFEFIHIIFELLESALDHLIEHLFHTDVYQTQLIVFYIMMAMGCGGLYLLWRILPPFCQRCNEHMHASWLRHKTDLLDYWAEQSLINKIKFIAIGATIIFGYLFFGM